MLEGVLGTRGAALEQQIAAELAAWRGAHPRATLTEIELAVEGATARLHAALTTALAAATGAPAAAAERPACPACGGRLRRRGRRTRLVLMPHQAQPVPLERGYLVCPACGAGLSPPR